MTRGRNDRREFLKQIAVAASALPLLGRPTFAQAQPWSSRRPPVPARQALQLHYRRPADESRLLREGLPIGNGHIGALVGGAPERTCLYVSEGSLWLGGGNDGLDEKGQFPYQRDGFGSLVMLARLYLSLQGHTFARLHDYRRSLDLGNGCVRVAYELDGVRYAQTLFASHPHGAIVLQLDQDGGGTHNGQVALASMHGDATLAHDGQLAFAGGFSNGLRYGTAVRLCAEGGRVSVVGDTLQFSGCRTLTIAFCGR